MPELPEVHGYQQYINATCLHQKITAIHCRDDKLFKMHPDTFNQHLIGEEFTGTRRIGKYLFVKTSGDRVLVMHFGMTGRPHYYKDEEARPKYAHIQFAFENGYHFGFENKRKFGWMDLCKDIDQYQKEKNLSDDARDLSWEDFKASFSNRKTYIKPILMDQSVAAGLGNWMVDEI
jgi:formamidopyrimidine-DNA glycosylase